MPKSRTALLGSLLLLAASSTCAQSQSQSLVLTPTARTVEASGLSRSTNTSPAPLAGKLVPFEQSSDHLQFTGEDDTRMLSFHLSEAQALTGGMIRLAYQNAVSVLPDDAVMDVEINGHEAGSFAIRSPAGYTVETLAISAEALLPGRNTLRLRARHHHRVDCSADAVYELWTRLDPVQSGFMTPTSHGFATVDDLLAVGRNADGFTEIRLIAPDGDRIGIARDSLKGIEALTLFLNRPDIKVTLADGPGEGAGIDLYVGSAGAYPQTPRARQLLAAAPAGLSVRDGDAAGRATVIMQGGNTTALQAALVTAVNGPMQKGLSEGVLAEAPDTIIAEQTKRYTLADVGYRSALFHGRLWRTQFNIEMPANFYPGDYDTVDVHLKAATAPGLAPGAQFLVRVNDKAVTSYRFRDPEGAKIDGKRIELPLRAFHPGANRIEFLAELPMASDVSCEVSRDETRPRFIMLEDTAIDIPKLARIGRMPDLAAMAGGAYPFNKGSAFDIVLERADTASLGAAMTFVAKLSLSARKPLAGLLKSGPLEETSDRDALIFRTSPAIAVRAATSETAIDPLFTSAVAATAPFGATAADSDALLRAFEASTALDEERLSLKTRFLNMLAKPLPAIGQWLKYDQSGDALYRTDSADALIELSQQRAPLGNATWTTLSAGTTDDLQAGVERLTASAVWTSLNGGSAIIRRSDGTLATSGGGDYELVEITDTSFSNLRRLAAAWFSDHFGIYVGLVVGCLGLFGLWLGYAVPRRGVRTSSDE